MKAIILFIMLLFTGLYAQDSVLSETDNEVYLIGINEDGDTIYVNLSTDWITSLSIYSDSICIPPPDTFEVFMLVSVVNTKNKTISGPIAVYGYEVGPAYKFDYDSDYVFPITSFFNRKFLTSEKKMIPHNWVIWRAIRKDEWENEWY